MRKGRYESARAFRQALDDRLRRERERSGRAIDELRKRVLIERLLARLFAEPAAPWLLKGGYALELRYRPRVRTTRDVDLAVENPGGSLAVRLEGLTAALRRAARADLGDFLLYDIGLCSELPGPPDGGGRFPVTVSLEGKNYGAFALDAGFGDPMLGAAEELVGSDWLAFAGLEPAPLCQRR